MDILSFSNINMWVILKSFALILLGMYLIFGLVVIKQVRMMTSTLQLGFETLARFLSYVHFLFAVLVFISAFIIL